MAQDVMVRAIAADSGVRAFVVDATRLVERARKTQDSLPAATAALGRVLSAAVMLAATIKEGERISIRVEGDGPVEGIFAQATPDGRVRGYVRNPRVNPPLRGEKLDVGAAVGRKGYLYVIRDLGMREPYVGRVALQTGEIGDDLAYYFATSEQQPSAVGLGVLVRPDCSVAAAGGYIIQPLPEASEKAVARIEENISGAPPPTELITTLRDPEKILGVLLAGLEWQAVERIRPRFYCGCSRRRSRMALKALPVKDLQEMIAQAEPARAACDFCAVTYEFVTEELERVLAEKQGEAAA